MHPVSCIQSLFSLLLFKTLSRYFFSVLTVIVSFRVRFFFYAVLFSQLHLAFFLYFTNRAVITNIFERKNNRKAFILICHFFDYLKERWGEMEAKRDKVTKHDLRHDRHTVSLLTDPLSFCPRVYRGTGYVT
jgi:predicted membrane protein